MNGNLPASISRPTRSRDTRRRSRRSPRPRPPASQNCPTVRKCKLCGIIATVKSMLTKKGDRMAYITLEDLQGTVEVIVFPDLFKTVGDLIAPERLVRITGTIDRGDKGTKIRGSKIEPLVEVQTQSIKRIPIRLATSPRSRISCPGCWTFSNDTRRHRHIPDVSNRERPRSGNGPSPSSNCKRHRTLCRRC